MTSSLDALSGPGKSLMTDLIAACRTVAGKLDELLLLSPSE